MIQISTAEAVQVIAEELGYDLEGLFQAKRQAEIVEEQQRRAKEAEQQRLQEIRRLEKSKGRFLQDMKEGKAVCFVDGKLKTSSLCKDGDPNVDDLARAYGTARQALLMNFKGYAGGAHTAATIDRDLQCSCGKIHKTRVFVTSEK